MLHAVLYMFCTQSQRVAETELFPATPSFYERVVDLSLCGSSCSKLLNK